MGPRNSKPNCETPQNSTEIIDVMCFNATLDGRWVIEAKYQYHDLTLVAKQKFRWSHFRNYLKPELSWVAVLGMAVGDAIVKSNSVSHPASNFVDPEILLRNYFETRNLPAFFILLMPNFVGLFYQNHLPLVIKTHGVSFERQNPYLSFGTNSFEIVPLVRSQRLLDKVAPF